MKHTLSYICKHPNIRTSEFLWNTFQCFSNLQKLAAVLQTSVSKSLLIATRINGPYPSFCLKTRFSGQNDKNLNNLNVTKNILFVNERQLLWGEKILVTKFYLYRRSINEIEEVSFCCHSNNFITATKNSESIVSLNASMNQISGLRSMAEKCCHVTKFKN